MADIFINSIKGGIQTGKKTLNGSISLGSMNLSGSLSMPTMVYEKNYEILDNLPQINGVTLTGNKTSHEIMVQAEMDYISEQEIDHIIYGE